MVFNLYIKYKVTSERDRILNLLNSNNLIFNQIQI